jgi:NADPH2:quinone reductase
MKAIIFDQAGAPTDVLRVADVPTAKASDGEALIKVTARPIHPADLAFVRGQYRIRPHFPQTAGLEGVGTVVEAPANSDLTPGTRAAFRWPGSWADFASVPLARLIAVPADVSDASASQISLNPVTAWGLLDQAQVAKGDWIVLSAATSSVCNLVGQLARIRGLKVIGTVRGDPADALSRCTADQVFSASDPDLVDNIIETTGERRVAALLDSVGGPSVAQLFGTLAPGARIIAYGVQEREPAFVTNAMLIYSNLTWLGFGIDRWLGQLTTKATAEMRAELWLLMRNGLLDLPIASVYPLESIGDALTADAQTGRVGKVLLA